MDTESVSAVNNNRNFGFIAGVIILVLLLINALAFIASGEVNDGIDGLGWLWLLLVYFLKAEQRGLAFVEHRLVGWLNSGVLLAIVFAELSFIVEESWLDVCYSLQWLAVIALFEWESRFPVSVILQPRLFRALGAGIFITMMILIGLWMLRGDWLNAYDAVLWSLAFVLIELQLLKEPG